MIQAGIFNGDQFGTDLMSDEEQAFHERFILAVRCPNARKPLNHCLVLDGTS